MADEKIALSVGQAIDYKGRTAYWDGFVAGAKAAADHAKALILRDMLAPAQPSPTCDTEAS